MSAEKPQHIVVPYEAARTAAKVAIDLMTFERRGSPPTQATEAEHAAVSGGDIILSAVQRLQPSFPVERLPEAIEAMSEEMRLEDLLKTQEEARRDQRVNILSGKDAQAATTQELTETTDDTEARNG